MNDGTNSHDPKAEDFLNKLIRAARDADEKGFVRPDDKTIDAYVLGSASEGQRNTMYEALAQSESFRREILSMARDIEKLGNIDFSAEGKAIEKRGIPELADFLQEAAAMPGEIPKIGFWRRIRNLFHLNILVPATAVATAVITYLVVVANQPSVQQVQRNVIVLDRLNFVEIMDPGFFLPNRVKGYPTPKGGVTPQYPSAIDAAREEISALSMGRAPTPSGVTRTVLLFFLDEKGTERRKISIMIPAREGLKDQPMCWILTWGINKTRNLYSFPVLSDTMKVGWDQGLTDSLITVFTYRTSGGYASIPGYLLP